MKQLFSFLSVVGILALALTMQAQAKDNNIYMNNAYWKGGSTFDVVVKETPNLKMKLYVNDKDPTETTVNGEGWATFRKVSLSGNGKISFTWVDSSDNEHPINCTSTFRVSDPTATFTENAPDPEPAAATPAPEVSTPAPQPAPQPAPVQSAPAPQPTVYYKNCTEARNAGVTPIYRGQPGYAAHLDRDNDGIACE